MDLTPEVLKDPVTKAQWESKLESIVRKSMTLASFMKEQVQDLPALLSALLSKDATITPSGTTGRIHPCPLCGKPLSNRKNDKGAYWGCFNKEGHDDGKPLFLPDERGRPGHKKAPPAPSD